MKAADYRAWAVVGVGVVLLGGSVAGCSRQTQTMGQGGGLAWTIGMEAGSKAAAEQSKPMMVDVYTDWCSWCKKLDKETYTDSQVAEKAKSFVCVKVNGEEDKASVSKFKVDGYPTILFLDASGKEIHHVTGYEPAAEFLKEMETALSKAQAK